MSRLICIVVLCLAPAGALAQSSAACMPAAPDAIKGAVSVPTDPVSSELRRVLDCYSSGLITAAQWFSPDKYNQHFLAETVAANIGHVAYVSGFACSKIAGVDAPKLVSSNDLTDKDKLVAGLKLATDFCKQAFSTLTDANLGESVPWDGFGAGWLDGWTGQRVTRFAAASWITHVLIERYGALVGSMQVGGSLSTIASVPLAERGFPPVAIEPEQSPLQDKPLTPPADGGSSSTLATEGQDFSGSYTLTASNKPGFISSESTVGTLRVVRTKTAIEVTRVMDGHKSVNRFPLDGTEGSYTSPAGLPGNCKGQFQGKDLILESVVTTQLTRPVLKLRTREVWELSSDLKVLTIASDPEFLQSPAAQPPPWTEIYGRN